MNYEIVISKSATKDVADIARYISLELHNVNAGLKFHDHFIEMLSCIKKFPRMYPVSEMLSDKRIMRLTPLDNYLIVYTLDENKDLISIIRVIYGKSKITILDLK